MSKKWKWWGVRGGRGYMNKFLWLKDSTVVDRWWEQLRYSMSAKLKYFIFDVMPDISNKSRGMRGIMNRTHNSMSFICIPMKFESAVDEVVTYCTEVCLFQLFSWICIQKVVWEMCENDTKESSFMNLTKNHW